MLHVKRMCSNKNTGDHYALKILLDSSKAKTEVTLTTFFLTIQPVPFNLYLHTYTSQPSIPTCTFLPVLSNLYLPTCTYQPIPFNLYLLTCTFQSVPSNLYFSSCIFRPVPTNLYLQPVLTNLYLPTCTSQPVSSDLYFPT